MGSPLSDLGLTASVLAAPMAGGAGTPALVTAAARAGGLGFLAAGHPRRAVPCRAAPCRAVPCRAAP
ncbi:nitronate monooxygenase [Actinoallomurus sp. CA-142502]|uniref:nitronate monooxygenase n=1 Tax=Actinoallomurus sp. CA-142502 TaxID=3239885 RepID=UPI003D8D1FCB